MIFFGKYWPQILGVLGTVAAVGLAYLVWWLVVGRNSKGALGVVTGAVETLDPETARRVKDAVATAAKASPIPTSIIEDAITAAKREVGA